MQNSKKAKSWKTALLMVLAFFLVMAALAAAGLVPMGGSGLRIGWQEHKWAGEWAAGHRYFLGTRSARLQGEGGTVHIEVETKGGSLCLLYTSPSPRDTR